MADSGPQFTGEPVLLADRLALLALAFIVAFIATILATILPLQLANISWQYRFTGALIDNAPVALLSLALVHLAVYLDPDNPHLLRWRQWFGRFAVVLLLLFLGLIPLQGSVLWRGSTVTSQLQGQQLNLVNREITALLKTIETSRSTPELIARLPPPVVASLGPNPNRLSLSALRKRLEGDAIRARNQLREQIDSPALADTWTLWKRSIRVMLSALFYAVAFASFILINGSELSLFREWQMGWRPWRSALHFPEDDSAEEEYSGPPDQEES